MAITDETRRLARAWKDELRLLSDAQVVALTAAWVALWDDLSPEYERIIVDLAAGHPEGMSAAQMARDDRIVQAMETTRERLDELVETAGDRIALDVPEVVRAGAEAPLEVLRSQLPESGTSAARAAVGVQFGAVNEEALAAIVARTTQSITARTMPLAPEIEEALRRRLTQGIVEGANPREVARRILRDAEGDFNGGLARATNIARTEMLDANRAADQSTAAENQDLILAQVWEATLDARTCMSCLEQHGQEFPPDTFGPLDHPQGRCTFIAKLRPWSDLGINAPEPPDTAVDARSWFEGLTAETQQSMLGPGRYEKWANGEISWGDFSERRENEDWRAAYYERPLKDL